MPWGGGQVSSDLYVDDGQKVNAFTYVRILSKADYYAHIYNIQQISNY